MTFGMSKSQIMKELNKAENIEDLKSAIAKVIEDNNKKIKDEILSAASNSVIKGLKKKGANL